MGEHKLKVKEIISQEAFLKMQEYVSMIEEKNKVMNLTGFSGEDLWREGIYESLISLKDAKPKKMLDIGAGVGFPSIPFIIANENIALTIVEPIKKRVRFLEEVAKKLKLNVEIKNTRVEELDQEEEFDFITARAVMSLEKLIEVSSLVGAIGSTYWFIKGPKAKEELIKAKKISSILKVSPKLKNINSKTTIVKYIKKYPTPKSYPRKWKDIIKNV